ncbi:hypothetical protein DV737_g39, partial [Chaetothyriales sp. CBS 132003]
MASVPSASACVIPTLFCGGNADEMVAFYTRIFPDSTIISTTTYPSDAKPEHGGFRAGETLSVVFSLLGGAMRMNAINGPASMFPFTEAVSFAVLTDSQAETDYYWEQLTSGGANPEKQHCCWCQDRFGLWWQVVPKEYIAVVEGADRAKAAKAMQVAMGWKKADLELLKRELSALE